MVNASLREGYLPASQKCALITPVLNKASLDKLDLKNYRPMSNLTFVSKVVEKVACEQLMVYCQDISLLTGGTIQWKRPYCR